MKKSFLSCLLLLSSSLLYADASQALQAKLNAIRTMQASFTQVVEADHAEISRSAGNMALLRPGKFRWQTKRPMPQLVVADGKKMWVYDVDLEQVTVKNQKEGISDTAALFLSQSNQSLAKDFSVKARKQGARDLFTLKPKRKGGSFSTVILVFAQDKLQGITLFDELGQKTSVRLLKVQNNVRLSDKLFVFNPPRGVDVVESQ